MLCAKVAEARVGVLRESVVHCYAWWCKVSNGRRSAKPTGKLLI